MTIYLTTKETWHFSRVAVATSENTSFGVHEWNKIRSDSEKIQIFCFFYAFIYNNKSSTYSSTRT